MQRHARPTPCTSVAVAGPLQLREKQRTAHGGPARASCRRKVAARPLAGVYSESAGGNARVMVRAPSAQPSAQPFLQPWPG
eukprot:1909400-Pleurochrysis_carterae.AAC.1